MLLAMVAVEGATEAGILIALAGGVGGFLGALLGQGLQWIREVQAERRVDRRRQEDRHDAAARERRERRHADYLAALGYLVEVRQELSTCVFMAKLFVASPDNEMSRDMFQDEQEKVRYVLNEGRSQANAKINAVGSERVVAMFKELDAKTVYLNGNKKVSNRMSRLTDNAAEEMAQRRAAGEDPSFFEYFIDYEIPWLDVAKAEQKGMEALLMYVDNVILAIRTELDLAA